MDLLQASLAYVVEPHATTTSILNPQLSILLFHLKPCSFKLVSAFSFVFKIRRAPLKSLISSIMMLRELVAKYSTRRDSSSS